MNRLDPSGNITPVGGEAPSSWLANYSQEDTSLAGMASMRVLQRVRVLQGMSPKPLRDQFGGEGAVILMPAQQLIAKRDQSFLFIPLLFFKEWIAWADRKDKNTKNAILERSFDENSALAVKANNADKRKETYSINGSEFIRTNVEHLNFAGILVNHPQLDNQPIVLGFAKGEWSTGKKYVNQILMRRDAGRTVPLWAQRWEFVVASHKNKNDQEWNALEPRNPTDGQLLISEEMGPTMQALHRQLAEDHKNRAMMVDRSDEATESADDLTDSPM